VRRLKCDRSIYYKKRLKYSPSAPLYCFTTCRSKVIDQGCEMPKSFYGVIRHMVQLFTSSRLRLNITALQSTGNGRCTAPLYRLVMLWRLINCIKCIYYWTMFQFRGCVCSLCLALQIFLFLLFWCRSSHCLVRRLLWSRARSEKWMHA